jgi:ABC-2 type transport system permease protein
METTMNAFNIPAALRIARKDTKIFLKERGTLLYLFVVPLAFILAFGGALGRRSDPKEETITLPVVNLDAGSEASGALLDALDQGGGIQCELYDETDARASLDKGDIKRVLTIPADYTVDLGAGRPVTLRLVNHADANAAKSEAVYRAVTGVAADLSLETQLIASFRQMADMEAAASPEQQAFATEVMIEQAQSQFARSRTEPLLAVKQRWPDHLLEEAEEDINPLSVLVPGFAVLFIFLTAQTTAMSIHEEKKIGSFRRLLAAPISKATILGGKMTPNFITGLAQTAVLFGTAVFIFPLLGFDRISLGNDPLALVLVCLIVLLCSTSLGLLIAAIARTEGQISGVSQVVLWAFGFAGILFQGHAIPIFDSISQAIPHYWANAALTDLLVRGQGLADVIPNILPLLGFTVAFLAVGLWRFEFD